MNRVNEQFVAAQILGGRDRQEDAFAIADLSDGRGEKLVFVVADGMGGHAGAAQVARLAAQQFCDAARNREGALAFRLRPALETANAKISMEGARSPAMRGAGCTLVAAAVEGRVLSWVSVGDSSLFLFRGRRMTKLNASRSAAVASGPRVRSGPQRANVLRGALTGGDPGLIEGSPAATPIHLLPGDIVILASDGLECVTEKRIASIVRRSRKLTPVAMLERLLAPVKDRPLRLQDNTTVVLYRVPHGNVPTAGPNSTPRQLWISVILLVLLGLLLFAAAKWWFP